jgi:hypothetical protein
LAGVGTTSNEERLLDEALAEFDRDGNLGTPWRDLLPTLRAGRQPGVTRSVTVRPAAAADLADAKAWYDDKRPRLGRASSTQRGMS